VPGTAIIQQRDRLRLCAKVTLDLRCAGAPIILALREDVWLGRYWRADLPDLRGGLDLKRDDRLAVIAA